MNQRCSVCGKTFTNKVRKPFFTNLALFPDSEGGGIETVCKSCALRLERRSAEAIREVMSQ